VGGGEGEKKTTPNLALGFALDIKLLDAKGQNTCNIDILQFQVFKRI
jgi:hypothetical protein